MHLWCTIKATNIESSQIYEIKWSAAPFTVHANFFLSSQYLILKDTRQLIIQSIISIIIHSNNDIIYIIIIIINIVSKATCQGCINLEDLKINLCEADLHTSPLQLSHFYRPTPNHRHFYTPDAQTTSYTTGMHTSEEMDS